MIMPMKFKPSTYKRVGGVRKGTHSYMTGTSTAILKETLEASNTKPKFKDKIRKELIRRGE